MQRLVESITAVQEHLHSSVDADTVRQIARDIVDERIGQNNGPQNSR